MLATGSTILVELREARDAKLAMASGQRPRPAASADLVMLDVPKAGKLDVIMSTAICVDLVRNGQAVKSTAHTSLQGYKGYRKLVTSAFVCGCYIFQLTDPPERMVKLAAQLH